MKLDAPMAMMLGVVGLGAFAVYRMSHTNAAPASPQPSSGPPGLPGFPSVPAVPLGETLFLEQGVRYEGRMKLQAVDVPPLSSTREQLADFLRLLGFSDVNVYMTSNDLPLNWTTEKAGLPQHRWFEATWSHPSTKVPKPQQLDRLAAGGKTLISGWGREMTG